LRTAWRIEQHQPQQLAGGARGHDRAVEAALHQQWQPTTVIEMGVCQQHKIDACGLEAEGLRVLFFQFAPALVQPAID
jgi:hypothetical protein